MQRSSREELPSGRLPRTVPHRAACAPLIDGLGHAMRSATYMYLEASHRLYYGHVIVSEFRAVLDLDTYALSNLIRPQCAEPGQSKPVLIMHIGFFACFHAISLEHSCFSKIPTLVFMPL